MAKALIPSGDTIRDFVKYIPVSAFKNWLRSKGKTFSTLNQSNYHKKLNQWIAKNKLLSSELDAAVFDIEESGGKKVFLRVLKGGFPNTKKKFDLFLVDKPVPVAARMRRSLRTKDSPTLNHVIWEEGESPSIVVKYSEVQQDTLIDAEHGKLTYIPKPVFIVMKIDVTSGFTEIRLDPPGKVHVHKDAEGKSSMKIFEEFYLNEISLLFEASRIEQFGLNEVAEHLVNKDSAIFRMNREASTVGGGGKQIYSCGAGDVRELAARVAAAEEDGENWIIDDITGYWLAQASGDGLANDLFMRLSKGDSTLRFQRDCIGAELNYAIGKIREIKRAASGA